MRVLRALGLGNLAVILTSVAFGVSGQLILKAGADRIGPVHLSGAGLAGLFSDIAGEPLLLFGYPFFIAGSVLWLVVLSRLNLSFAYPFLGIHYVLITLTAWLILGETVVIGRWAAVGLIVIGILIVGQSEVMRAGADSADKDRTAPGNAG